MVRNRFSPIYLVFQIAVIQTSTGNPAVSNPPKNTPGTNGGGLTRSDCIWMTRLCLGLLSHMQGPSVLLNELNLSFKKTVFCFIPKVPSKEIGEADNSLSDLADFGGFH